MFYSIIRIIILLIIYLCLFLFWKKTGTDSPTESKRLFQSMRKAHMIKLSKKAIVLRIVVLVVIFAIVFIPFEAPFVHFKSPEAPVHYSSPVFYTTPIRTVETDKTVFSVAHRGNNFRYNIITKHGDKYGFCNLNSKAVLNYRTEYIRNEDFFCMYTVTKLINYTTNEKCYMIKFLDSDSIENNDIIVYDDQNNPVNRILFPDKRSIFTVVMERLDQKAECHFYDYTIELE